MKNKQVTAILLSAVMAISICAPMNSMTSFAAENVAEESTESEAKAEVPIEAESADELEDQENAAEESTESEAEAEVPIEAESTDELEVQEKSESVGEDLTAEAAVQDEVSGETEETEKEAALASEEDPGDAEQEAEAAFEADTEEAAVTEEELATEEGKEAKLAGDIVDSGTCGENATWTLTGTDDNLTLTISGSGDIDNYLNAPVPWESRRTDIKTIIIEDGIINIGEGAFDSCTSLTSVTIPDSVKVILQKAFGNCSSLTEIVIPKGVTYIGICCFSNCNSLREIKIPEGVKRIDLKAFQYCTSLVSVELPTSLQRIYYDAFEYCDSLRDIYYKGTKADWDSIENNEFLENNLLLSSLPNVTLHTAGDIYAQIITLNKSSATIVKGKTLQLKATVTPADATDGKVTWKSGNTNVATVTSTGSIKAVSAGATTITAVTEGGLKASCTIKVVNPYTIKFDKNVEKKVAAKVTLTTTSKKVNPGSTLSTLPTPKYTGYYFLGWYTDRSGGTKVTPSTKPTKNMTLYAHWVVRKSIKKATVKVGSCMYTGKWCRPSVTVMLGTKTLKKYEDFSFSYSNCLDAGSKGVIKITGKGRYKDSISRTFTVSKCSMGEKYISAELSKTTYNYTGKAIKPGITVYLNGRYKLTRGKDYKVTYKNNIEPGKATVQITGMGNFESKSRYFTFTIAKLNQPIKLSRTSLSLQYKNIGTTYDVTATGVKESAGMTVSSSNTSVATVSGSSGKYKIKIKGCGKTNIIFKTNKATKHYKITSIKLPITVADRKMPTISLPQQTYDLRAGDAPFNLGATCDSDGVITYTSSDTEILTVDKTGTVTLTGNKGGSVNITVTSKATQNYKEGTAVVNVTVTIKPIWEIRMEEFQKDSRWSVNGAAWGDGKKPELSNASDSESCVAYANDFVAYVYGQRNQKSDPRKANRPDRTSDESSAGTDPGIIKAGDIIQFFKGYNAEGERLIHLIVVISVDHSTGMMYTMEGNAGHKIRIGSNYYRINNGKVEESFNSGWTVQTIDWIKQFDSWKD